MKRKWYKSNIAKTGLILTAHLMVVVMTVSFLWIMAYPALRIELFEGNPAEEYCDSGNFAEQMRIYSSRAVAGIGAKQILETDGNYNPDKLVDLEEFYDTAEVSGEALNGVSYRLGDLIDWKYELNNETEPEEKIIVCKKTDGTFYYYRISEFMKLIENKELLFIAFDGEYTTEILYALEYGDEMPEDRFRGIQTPDGMMLYSDCWIYDGTLLHEEYSPLEAGSILDLVNTDMRWNGRLNEVYNMLRFAIENIGDYYENYEMLNQGIQEGDTNFFYLYADKEQQCVYTNKKAYERYEDLDKNIEKMKSLGKYVVVSPLLADFESNMELNASEWRDEIKYTGCNIDNFVFIAAVDTSYPVRDNFYTENQLYEKYGSGARQTGILFIMAGILLLVCVLWLIAVAGRSNKDEELHLNWFDKWKTELAAGSVILGWLVPFVVFCKVVSSGAVSSVTRIGTKWVETASYVENSIPYIAAFSAFAVFTCLMFLIGILSLVRRIKARTVWKNSVLKWLFEFICMIFRNLNSVWKTIVLFGAFAFIQLLFLLGGRGRDYLWVLLMFLADVAAFVYLVYKAVGRKIIGQGIKKIAGGELEYKIPLELLRGEQRIIAQEINCIGEGLDAAVEKSMKSERLKTDLITNVSHDIKTPLTSIINYVELLKQENFEDPKIQRYIEVLEQKSQRLKTLTEDVVEASKVSSGNITLEYMNINLVEMIQQTSGEFEEKFRKRNLKEVLTLPEEDALIYVDGRRTWRVLENIYNNAAKYAMEGTRVYADLIVNEQEVSFRLKNISEQPLNISADELTERFIRGDVSRSTEGSGLGLSIAKTLTEMQGGKFELYLDGDLFKATVTFPRVKN